MAGLSKLFGWGLVVVLLLSGGAILAQDSEEEPEPEGGEVTDVIVVTASRMEQRLQEVPVAMTVISADELATMPADDYGDVLRNVPGLNVTQISARDIQVNTRKASGSLSTDQLVLLDGRTVYLDFFGFVMWDLLPLNFNEIAQVEVVRGPGSAVWGANALGGVINLITKSPWEAVGTSVTLGAGELSTLYGTLTHAAAGEKTGYKISTSYYEQDAYDRPTGIINGTEVTNPPGTPYPSFENEGTEQPKIDLRLDYNQTDDTSWSFSAGYAGTDGIVHSGIGPFDVDSSSNLSYAKVSWAKKALTVNAFANLLDGEANNLLTRGLDGSPLVLGFESQTYNIDFANTNIVGERNIITYGATFKTTDFDLSIAPLGEARDEFGVFLQDEIMLGDKVRWLIGARWDDIDSLDGPVVSPRTSLMFAPSPDHNFRISYNEAFRAASVVENFLSVEIVNQVVLPAFPPLLPTPSLFAFPSRTAGNSNLKEESLKAYEIGYVGNFAEGKGTVTVAVYSNELTDGIDFFASEFYSSFDPPPGWPLPPFIPVPVPGIGVILIETVPEDTFPKLFTYRNIGEQTNEGFEFSFDFRPNTEWRVGFNYSYQDEPELSAEIEPGTINIPGENRFNFALSYSGDKFFSDLNVNYVDEAFWTDVLDARFHGTTEDYTMTNLSLGYRFNDKVTLSVIGVNVFDDDILQHIFGDVISRKVTGQLQLKF
ncbi:MAG: TonB-dependent receptor [bacterium]|nr:TonB-dependent receptor [bacterium]